MRNGLWSFFELRDSCTRVHGWKIVKPQMDRVQYGMLKSVRVVNCCNKVPLEVVDACYLNNFKRELDKYAEKKGATRALEAFGMLNV